MQQRHGVDADREAVATGPARRAAVDDRKVREVAGGATQHAHVDRWREPLLSKEFEKEARNHEVTIRGRNRVQRPHQHRVERFVWFPVLADNLDRFEQRRRPSKQFEIFPQNWEAVDALNLGQRVELTFPSVELHLKMIRGLNP